MRSSREYYDNIAAEYRNISHGKQAFLDSVDDYIIEKIGHARNYMDVGAGDGYRSLKIATGVTAGSVVLVDNSPAIISKVKADERIAIVVDSILNVNIEERFDLITCLWNVLGHVGDAEDRKAVITKIASLLSPDGTFVLDLNNRYNIAHYGYVEVMKNMTNDVKNHPDKGWFTIGTGDNMSRVYIHAPLEIDPVIEAAGLYIDDVYYVDYRTGEKRESFFEGQLLYFLKKK